LNDRELKDIDSRKIEEAIVALQLSSKTGGLRSPATMNRIKSAVRCFFRWALQSGIISRNPASTLSISKAPVQPTIPISIKEIRAILQTISASSNCQAERDRALFATYAYTGTRCAEALALRIRDYDKSSLALHLPRVKGGDSRRQPIPRRLSVIIAKWIDNLRQKEHTDLNSSLFPGRGPERPLTTRQVRARFYYWKKISGIREDLTVHSFRAGFATQLYRTTGDLLLVNRAMGHRNVQTTMRYIGNHFREIRAAIERGFK
jgi:integrase/recombinase XerC